MYLKRNKESCEELLSRYEYYLEKNKFTAPAIDLGIAAYKIDKLKERIRDLSLDPPLKDSPQEITDNPSD